jgi:hypothetical protein
VSADNDDEERELEKAGRWLAAALDCGVGTVVITGRRSPTLVALFETAYPDRLGAIQRRLSGLGRINGPRKARKPHHQDTWILQLTGSALVRLETLAVPYMETQRRFVFVDKREELRQLRGQLGLAPPFVLLHVDPDDPELLAALAEAADKQ